MAVLALGLVGAGIGSAIGGTLLGMSAASIGWSIGSTLGAILFAPDAPDTQGPRLNDLRVQTSTRGAPIPKVYGTSRIAGNVIWSVGIKETSHTQSVGGKGGGGSTHTSYTYSCSFAVGLSEGEITGIRRIWADSVLIYNKGDTATNDELAVSDQIGISIYTGSETQEPDPTIEADKGVGNVPGYRGLAYVVFTDLQLEKYGNRIPNITCEVVGDGYVDSFFEMKNSEYPAPVNYREWVITKADSSSVRVAYPGNSTVYVLDGECNYVGTDTATAADAYPGSSPYGTYPDPGYGLGVLEGQFIYATFYKIGRPISEHSFNIFTASGAVISNSLPDSAGYICGITIDTTHSYMVILTNPTSATSGMAEKWWKINVSGNVIASGACSGVTGSWYFIGLGNRRIEHFSAGIFDGSTQTLWTAYGAGTGPIYKRKIVSNVMYQEVYDYMLSKHNFTYPSIWADGSKVWVISDTSAAFYLDSSTVSVNQVSLSSILSDLCVSTGVSNVDHSAVPNAVQGYVRTQRMTAAAAIAPLLDTYNITAAESDYQLKFTPRIGTPSDTIDSSELAAHRSGTAPDPLKTTRTDDTQLPRKITVNYTDFDGDYQPGVQQAQRVKVDG